MKKPSRRTVGRPSGPSPRTLATVISATSALLTQHGYAGTTIEGIAERSGVAKTTIYRWWPSKIMLFMALFEDVVTRPLSMQEEKGNLEQELFQLYSGLARLLTTTSAGATLVGMIVEAQLDPGSAETFRAEFSTRGRVLTRAILQRAQERGEFHNDCDAELVISILSGALWYRLLLGDLGNLGDSYVAAFVSVVLNGVCVADSTIRGSSCGSAEQ